MTQQASTGERRILLEEWNPLQPAAQSGLLVHEFLELHARETPGTPAIVDGDRTVTYRELNERANRLAHHLQSLGVGPDELVGIFLERSPELVEAVFATLKAGGACLPLDPGTPAERLQILLKESRARVVLTMESLAGNLPAFPAVSLDADRLLINRYPAQPPLTSVGTGNLSRVFFTSGSTGTPKAVMWSHKRLQKDHSWFQRTFQVTANDRFLMKASLAFTPINLEIFQPITLGATVYIAAPNAERDTARLTKHIAEYGITILNIVPTMLRLLLEDEGWRRCACLRHVICFGEALPPELEAAFFAKSAASLTVIYGATEAPSATFRRCIPGQLPDGINIGRRIGNKQVLVLNEALDLSPIGVAGELCIGGDGLALGYLNAPELTARKFIANPFANQPGAQLYRTGDRGRYLPDGSLEFLGRTDDQVKIRGFRVELGEVEAALRRQPLVHDAAVVARADASGASSLIAYLTGVPPSSLDVIRQFLRRSLPGYMVPGRLVCVDSLPMTAIGKIDRQALPPPDAAPQHPASPPLAAPRTQGEAKVAEIWREVLGLKQVGIHDNFFDIGGHSLLGIRLVARLRAAFCTEFSLPHLFDAPTVAEQALLIERGTSENRPGPWRCLVEIQRGEPSHAPLFLVPGGGGGTQEFLVYGRFVRYIGAQWPVYGFCARGMDGRQVPHTNIGAMAADYLRELRARQPHGPYFLAGECVGGIAAYEMARRLCAEGETVAFLALLDTLRPTFGKYIGAVAKTARKRFLESRQKVLLAPLLKRMRVLRKQCVRLGVLLGDQWGWMRANPFPARADKRISYIKRVRAAYSRTLLRYRPKPYPGDIAFFVSEDGWQRHFAADWQPLIGGTLECHRLAGDHDSYIRDHGKAVGELFGACLNRKTP
ncbi:MAG: amino acid adenylation domain-containing protein [Verrucomicrobiota bacterium]